MNKTCNDRSDQSDRSQRGTPVYSSQLRLPFIVHKRKLNITTKNLNKHKLIFSADDEIFCPCKSFPLINKSTYP